MAIKTPRVQYEIVTGGYLNGNRYDTVSQLVQAVARENRNFGARTGSRYGEPFSDRLGLTVSKITSYPAPLETRESI